METGSSEMTDIRERKSKMQGILKGATYVLH